MRTISIPAILLTLIAASPVLATDYTGPKQYNPQNDPDVQRGYDENQRQNREREDQEQRANEGGITKPYDVDVSGEDSAGGKRDK
jgi:hypothetical protein